MKSKIRVAIFGVTQTAETMIELIAHCKMHGPTRGNSAYEMIGGYEVADLQIAAVFDHRPNHRNKRLTDMLLARSDSRKLLTPSERQDLAAMTTLMPTDLRINPLHTSTVADGVEELQRVEVDVAIISLPDSVSKSTQETTANAAATICVESGVPFINATDSSIATDPEWRQQFLDGNLPVIGDGLQTQCSDEYISQMLADLCDRRSIAVSGWAGPVRFQPHQTSTTASKWSLSAHTTGNTKTTIEVHVHHDQQPSSASNATDCLRLLAVASEMGIGGVLEGASSFYARQTATHIEPDEAFNECESLAARRTCDTILSYNNTTTVTQV